MAHIGHFVRHDQVVLDVDGGLHVVADDAGAFASGRHCASIWIGQRDLPNLARPERRSPSLAGAAFVASGGRACPLAESIWLRRPRPLADRLCPVPISNVRYWLRPAPYDARSHRACSSCPECSQPNRLPSIAITVSENKSSRRHSMTNWRQVALIAGPLSLRKSAMVLKSGMRRPVSHISSMLRWVSRSSRRL